MFKNVASSPLQREFCQLKRGFTISPFAVLEAYEFYKVHCIIHSNFGGAEDVFQAFPNVR